jgi:hypothetical protein
LPPTTLHNTRGWSLGFGWPRSSAFGDFSFRETLSSWQNKYKKSTTATTIRWQNIYQKCEEWRSFFMASRYDIPRLDNWDADHLAWIASSRTPIPPDVIIEKLTKPSIKAVKTLREMDLMIIMELSSS